MTHTSTLVNQSVWGNMRAQFYTVNISSYTTGGEVLSDIFAQFSNPIWLVGLDQASQNNTYIPILASKSLKAVVANTGTEVTSATNIGNVLVLVIGQ